MESKTTNSTLVLSVSMLMLLSACGGGGGESPATPTAPATPTPPVPPPVPAPGAIVSYPSATISGVVGLAINVASTATNTSSPIASCVIRAGSANAAAFAAAGFTVNNTTCAITGTPTALMLPMQFTIEATNQAAVVEQAQITVSIELQRNAYVYAAQSGLDSIAVYSSDPATGVLTAVSTMSTGAGSQPYSVVADASGRFLYAAKRGTDQIAVYAINPASGALTLAATTGTGDEPNKLLIDPTGRFLFANQDGTARQVTSYRINDADGTLTFVSDYALNSSVTSLTIDRTGRFLFCTSLGGGMQELPIDQVTGEVGVGLTNTTPLLVNDLAFDPLGRRVYTLLASGRDIVHFSFNPANGTLGASIFYSGASSFPSKALSFDPESRFLFAADTFQDGIDVYAINASTGALSAAASTTVEAGCRTETLNVDPTGRFLYVACSNAASTLATYAIDRASGALTLVGTPVASSTASVKSIASVHVAGRFLYAANGAASNIATYSINSISGSLSEAVPVVTASVATPTALSVDQAGNHLYAINTGASSIATYSIARTTGALSVDGASVATSTGANSFVLHPTGRYAYVTNGTANTVSRFAVAASGDLSNKIDLATAAQPLVTAIHRSARYAYVASGGAQPIITMYTLDDTTGELTLFTSFPTVSTAGASASLKIDVTGRYLYASTGAANGVESFRIDPTTGRLFRTNQSPLLFAGSIDALTIDPTGRYIFAASSSANSMAMFSIARLVNPDDHGALTLAHTRASTVSPSTVTMDVGGRFLFSAASAPNALLSFGVSKSPAQVGVETNAGVANAPAAIVVTP